MISALHNDAVHEAMEVVAKHIREYFFSKTYCFPVQL
jgi:hypothetical protein